MEIEEIKKLLIGKTIFADDDLTYEESSILDINIDEKSEKGWECHVVKTTMSEKYATLRTAQLEELLAGEDIYISLGREKGGYYISLKRDSIIEKVKEHIRCRISEKLRGWMGDIYGQDWESRTWQLTYQLFSQSWNVFDNKESKMEACAEYAHKLVDTYLAKAEEIKTNELKERYDKQKLL